MTEVKKLDRGAILGAVDLPATRVDMPEWGGCVFVRGLTAEEADALSAADDGKEAYARRLIAFCAVDENGVRLFGDADVADLGRKSARAVARLATAIIKANGLGAEAKDELAGN
jgi:hypothetical protein